MTKNCVILDGLENWSSPEVVSFYLDTIFKDETLKGPLKELLRQKNLMIPSFQDLLKTLDNIFRDNIRFENSQYSPEAVDQLERFARYKKTVNETFDAYNLKTKPNPSAVYWPNPKKYPDQSVYETLPVVENLGWVTHETQIGSAGSCFASEIAFNLQERGFRYVVTERSWKKELGVFGSSDEANRIYPESSAHWGILFNTASFRQLAERAFGVREMPRLLLKEDGIGTLGVKSHFYSDPFREGVGFMTTQAYEEDYPQHSAAIREALLQSEVFVITPGLNECWELILDGSVIARNPRHDGLAALIRHRILTVEENISNLQRFIDIIRAHNPKIKFIISVSPVPFLATGRGNKCHVMTANGHSKAVLRVAAEEIVNRNRDVAYFPSYELVMTGIKDPWQEDQRHVSSAAVLRIMQLFDAMFIR